MIFVKDLLLFAQVSKIVDSFVHNCGLKIYYRNFNLHKLYPHIYCLLSGLFDYSSYEDTLDETAPLYFITDSFNGQFLIPPHIETSRYCASSLIFKTGIFRES